MINDHLDRSSRYSILGPGFRKAFEYLRATDFSHVPTGKHEIEGEALFVYVQDYKTKLPNEGTWEAHRRYADVQFVISGIERVGVALIDHLKPGVYDAVADLMPLSGRGDWITLRQNEFAIFLPQDGHMPGIAVDGPAPVKKAVVKVLLGS